MAATKPILMSPTNPQGWKLEELLRRLQLEIQGKCDKIARDTETDPAAMHVFENNKHIIAHLAQAEASQRRSMNFLHACKGPNQGPLGTPRIGIGAKKPTKPKKGRG